MQAAGKLKSVEVAGQPEVGDHDAGEHLAVATNSRALWASLTECVRYPEPSSNWQRPNDWRKSSSTTRTRRSSSGLAGVFATTAATLLAGGVAKAIAMLNTVPLPMADR